MTEVFLSSGQVQGVKGHSILHCAPWLAGILRSVDSICWQGADLEAVAFSCTGRRLARAANGFRAQGLGVLGFRVRVQRTLGRVELMWPLIPTASKSLYIIRWKQGELRA